MDWIEAAKSIPPIEGRDLLRFSLTGEEQESVLKQYNKSLQNAASDSADIASITLRKLLTRFPDWGEAALLYGICLAIDGKMTRAFAGFQHALDVGLRSEKMTYLAQVCAREANAAQKVRSQVPENNNPAMNLISSVLPKSNPLIQEENQIRPRAHMQAPILMKASRHPTRAKLATDRERRELMMKSTSSNGELPDDEINVSIPKTPAEKLRIAIFVFAALLLLTCLYFLISLWIIPSVGKMNERNRDSERLDFLTRSLYEKNADPEISEILSQYESQFPSQVSATNDGT